MRDRLIELIASKVCDRYEKGQCASNWNGCCGVCLYGRDFEIGDIADHLLANGVVLVDTEKVGIVNNREPIQTAFGMPLDELADLIRATGDGRIIVPPCMTGATVYKVAADKRFKHPHEHKVIGIWCSSDEKCNYVHIARVINGFLVSSIFVPIDEFGKTVFLTREEAKKELERRNRDAE